jgi:hypothetical protein
LGGWGATGIRSKLEVEEKRICGLNEKMKVKNERYKLLFPFLAFDWES